MTIVEFYRLSSNYVENFFIKGLKNPIALNRIGF
jgi:hypothetical protein